MIDLLERIPPQALDAEGAVIAAVMLDPANALPMVLGRGLRPEHFYAAKFRCVYDSILRLNEAGLPPDSVTLRDDLAVRGELERVGGEHALRELVDHVPSAANAEYYAGIVIAKARLRVLVTIGADIAKAAYDSAEPADVIADRAEGRLVALLAERADGSPGTFKEALVAELDRLEHPPVAPGFSCGIRSLDDVTGGLRAGRLYVVGARPGAGKTSLLCQIAHHVSGETGQVLFFQLEQDRADVGRQMIAQRTGLSLLDLASGRVPLEARGAVERAVRSIWDRPIVVEDAPSLTLQRLRARARLAKLREGLALVVLDYLQLLDAQPAKGEIREQSVARMSRGLKLLARELQVPLIVAAQLNRASESRDGHRPRLSDLRESGAVEQDCDVALLLHRPELAQPDKTDLRGKAEVVVAKNRAGRTGLVTLKFEARCVRFEETTPSASGHWSEGGT